MRVLLISILVVLTRASQNDADNIRLQQSEQALASEKAGQVIIDVQYEPQPDSSLSDATSDIEQPSNVTKPSKQVVHKLQEKQRCYDRAAKILIGTMTTVVLALGGFVAWYYLYYDKPRSASMKNRPVVPFVLDQNPGVFKFEGERYLCHGPDSVYKKNPELLSSVEKELCDKTAETADLDQDHYKFMEADRIPVCQARKIIRGAYGNERLIAVENAKEITKEFVDNANRLAGVVDKKFFVHDPTKKDQPKLAFPNFWSTNGSETFKNYHDPKGGKWYPWMEREGAELGKACIPLMIADDAHFGGPEKKTCGHFVSEPLDHRFVLNSDRMECDYGKDFLMTHEAGHALLPQLGANACKDRDSCDQQDKFHSPFVNDPDVMGKDRSKSADITNNLKNRLVAYYAKTDKGA